MLQRCFRIADIVFYKNLGQNKTVPIHEAVVPVLFLPDNELQDSIIIGLSLIECFYVWQHIRKGFLISDDLSAYRFIKIIQLEITAIKNGLISVFPTLIKIRRNFKDMALN